MAFDSLRGVTVLFGGLNENSESTAETWEFDGDSWTLRSRLGPTVFNVSLVFDTHRDVSVLLGCGTSQEIEVWEWDGVEWNQREGAGPSCRNGFAAAYDSIRGVTVMFGGDKYVEDDYLVYQDTWEWNGVSWALRSTDGPLPRSRHAMTYDDVRNVVVLFGGYDGASFGDTWEWNGTLWTFRSDVGPLSRRDHALVFDRARGITVLFGGFHNTSEQADTWEWDGDNWVQRFQSGPVARQDHAMVYDSLHQVTILYGGQRPGFLRDHWEWDGSTWVQRTPTGPPLQSNHSMAFDTLRQVTVLFGRGSNGSGSETWEWDGQSWALKSTTGPSRRIDAAMAYDQNRGVTVLFGGNNCESNCQYFGDTWAWNGTTWTLKNTVGPSPRSGSAMAFDSTRGFAWLFGGRSGSAYSSETWRWNGTLWSLRVTTGPAPGFGRGMTFDDDRSVSVMGGGYSFDGVDTFADDTTWEWNGTAWALRNSQSPGGAGYAIAYDSTIRATVLFGGSDAGGVASSFYSSTWQWDGTNWSLRTDLAGFPRYEHDMVFDSARDSIFLFGGYVNESYASQPTWELIEPEADFDGDGVSDLCDDCGNTPPDTAVRQNGCVSGDSDVDGDADLADFVAMQRCFGLSAVSKSCLFVNFDQNSNITLLDLALFVSGVTGPK